ncbi:MAG: DEAD/DEAH box helicase family protein [Candidatus Poribacteria bacterium]|nr:DEAD/DEAH box helicase family protein [Candidatus Poribacteria bacterium]MDE0506277.1 DEAD/DEAH box helicase family protein [Candidatus Poribacteria bacterium]
MPETEQFYLDIQTEGGQPQTGLRGVIDYIREEASSQYRVGNEFERLIKQYFSVDPLYKERFSDVWLWGEWAAGRADFDATDIGIDLVAQESSGEYCAIQCKCYALERRVSKPDIDSFIAASASDDFRKRILVHTGGELGANVRRTIEPLGPDFQVIGFGHLNSRPIDWPDLRQEQPEQLDYRQQRFSPRPYQEEAIHDVINGFKASDRGKLIMACGTGKTFTALRIAEEIASTGGRVLYLVPSIGLFSQTMREWAEQQGVKHRYIGICSDESAGRNTEDVPIQELEIPVTTEPLKISEALQETDAEGMTVVFCTYHSLRLVENAQDQGAPPFDIVFCDEAHKTTGIEQSEDDAETSPFVLIHDSERIRAEKRLYMTATPRIYTEGAKVKAAHHDIEVFSMDDPGMYGPEFHRLPFSKAVEERILSDYKVAIFTMYEPNSDAALQGYIGAGGSEINITDATKFVGCWRTLQNPEGKLSIDDTVKPLTRVIAFNNTIRNSKRLVDHWNEVIESAMAYLPENQRPVNFQCETQHVDGQHNAFDRKNKIEWLKGDSNDACRILSNARCLSEGIDVPALDAVMFMTPRNSHVDIVQAVGRVMRKADDKDYGYIILPVAIPPGTDPAKALDNNERFASVWSVLRALRSHDDRLDAEINKIDLNNKPTDRIILIDGDGDGDEQESQQWIPFGPVDIPPQDIFAKIVEKCGDRKYWESWAKDVADIFQRVAVRINNLLDNPINEALGEYFDNFHAELKNTINDSITREDAIEMMAQHILTRPVFEAMFEGYDFASGNPVAIALDHLRTEFWEFGLEDETRDLEGFYESVRTRAQGIDNSEGRQTVLLELYEKFFATALKKDAERLGIVYTPVEVVDFILHSADEILREEFGRSLSDEGVHVLDPFAGAGVFLSRLIQSDLIRDADLERKYREELHANEIVLLAYYIAAVNIEEAYRGRQGDESDYEPFDGIVLTDTFNLNKKGEDPTLFPKEWMPDNNARAERQQEQPIEVIVGNPPWSAGQQRSEDNNPNVDYPALKNRIEETYSARYSAGGERHRYNTYKMAIRWASDRIKESGVVAFVTNGSWIEANADAGIRACLAEEFSSIHVLHLRGNQRTQGERSRREGGKVFGSGSRAPVAITILVKNPNTPQADCRIHYRDIGDYLSRDEKLDALDEALAISGVSDWQEITPNRHYDWIEQRNDAFAQFYPLGSDDARRGRTDDTIFTLYSLGWQATKNLYIYNFASADCAKNAWNMTKDYLAAIAELEENPELTADEAARRHSSNITWVTNLKSKLTRKKKTTFDEGHVRKVLFRPFIPVYCYADPTFAISKYNMDEMFPDDTIQNRLICVTGKASAKPFSALMTDTMPDLEFISKGQCFSRYRYPSSANTRDSTPTLETIQDRWDLIDNIADATLQAFCSHYNDGAITKDSIFDYVYGILHAPTYREEFATNFPRELARIPFAPDFFAFSEAGKALGDLHVNYENCERHPLEVIFAHEHESQSSHFQLTERAMRFADDEKTTLIINEHVSLSGIPEESHRYVVNGRTPLEWFIDNYRITRDGASGIINDPNGWFEDPRDLVTAIERIVYVSVESTRIIEGLPSDVTGAVER